MRSISKPNSNARKRAEVKLWLKRSFMVLTAMTALGSASCAGANIVQNGGFETGSFSGWALLGDPSNTQVSIGFPHSGFYGALFGAMNMPEYISQSLATSPGQTYTLSFWMGSGDGGGGIPNQFIVKWGDTPLLDQANLVVPSWTNMQFKVTAASTTTVLTFGGWDNQDYVYLDDVSVSIPSSNPPPKFLTVTATNGLVQFTWSAVAGRDYQLEYTSGLSQGIWINLGSPLRATSTTMSGSDPVGINSRRFYRVILLP